MTKMTGYARYTALLDACVLYSIAMTDALIRKWQHIHHRGTDFIIYSDHRDITLRQPIEIEL